MKYAVDIVSDGMTYILSRFKFHKDLFRHSNAIRGATLYRDTDTTVISYAYFYFVKTRKVG
jgi:hypothetical protein